MELFEEGKYQNVVKKLENITDYKDAQDYLNKAKYLYATAKNNSNNTKRPTTNQR